MRRGKNVPTLHTSEFSRVLFSYFLEQRITAVVLEEKICTLSRQPVPMIMRILSRHRSLTFCGSSQDSGERDILFLQDSKGSVCIKAEHPSSSFPNPNYLATLSKLIKGFAMISNGHMGVIPIITYQKTRYPKFKYVCPLLKSTKIKVQI